ncbi:hypothetical protein MPTK2_3g11270 [Marchantia polymorpha subsp. ruderalis]
MVKCLLRIPLPSSQGNAVGIGACERAKAPGRIMPKTEEKFTFQFNSRFHFQPAKRMEWSMNLDSCGVKTFWNVGPYIVYKGRHRKSCILHVTITVFGQHWLDRTKVIHRKLEVAC